MIRVIDRADAGTDARVHPETQIGGPEATALEHIRVPRVPAQMAKQTPLRIASYNINGINSRLHVLTRWLDEFRPDIVGLQELKCTDEAFPARCHRGARLFRDLARPAQLERRRAARRVGEPVETRRALPDDPDLEQSRYIEAAVCGILVGNMYAPNGNPKPGPKFDYKLAWLDALKAHAQALLDSKVPAILIGDYNVIPTDMDVYKPERWAKDALFAPEAREKYRELVAQGWTDAIRHLHPGRADLHLLALLAELVRARRRHPHRPCAAEPVAREEAQGGRRRPHAARLGEDQRPCTDVGRGGGGEVTVPDAGIEPATFGLQNRCSTS